MSEQATGSLESPSASVNEIYLVLRQWSTGDPEALNTLFSQIFNELRRIARHLLQGERSDHTLEPTALVNELYIRLTEQRKVDWANSRQFFAFATRLMRLILVDHARRRQTDKRGKGIAPLALDEILDISQRQDVDLVRLDEALKDLATIDPRQSKVVELRFFIGLSVGEIEKVTGYSRATVLRDWRAAKLWLFRRLQRGAGEYP